MKEPFSEEILSAYLDGELTPQECVAVERWVKSNAAARAKLEDFRRLSGLFDSLPRTELPREFPTQVLQLSERRMLLPETVAMTARRRLHIRLLAVAASIGSAAALVFLAVHLLGPGLAPQQVAGPDKFPAGQFPPGRAEPRSGDSDDGRHGAIEPDERLVAQDDRETVAAGKGALSVPAPLTDQTAAADAPREDDGAKSDGKSMDLASRAAKQAGPTLMQSRAQTAGSGGVPGAAAADNPQLAAINESLGQLRDSGADEKLMSVVRLHVIDHAGGLELVQNILSENNVVLSSDVADGLEKTGDRTQKKRGPTAGRKEALYVVARPEQVMAAFTAMIERDSPTVRLTVEEPIQVASFDPDSRKQLEDLLRGLNRASVMRDEPAPPEAADKAAERGKARPSAEKSPAADDADKATAKPEGRSAPPAPGAAAMPEKKKMRSSTRRPAPGADQALTKETEKAKSTNGDEAQDEAAPKREGSQVASAPGRQLVVPVPRELEERQARSAAAAPPAPARAARNALAAPADAGKGGGAPAREEKTLTEGEQMRRAPALVRVLIVIEPEDPRPAVPAAGKNPDGGAS